MARTGVFRVASHYTALRFFLSQPAEVHELTAAAAVAPNNTSASRPDFFASDVVHGIREKRFGCTESVAIILFAFWLVARSFV